MAEGRVYRCNGCGLEITAWSDGNPYYFDRHGEKQYAHHPDPKVGDCVGNDSDVICLHCGERFRHDHAKGPPTCTACQSNEVLHIWLLVGRKCPYCRKGEFEHDPSSSMIS